jgi:hypothetical protein
MGPSVPSTTPAVIGGHGLWKEIRAIAEAP